MWRVVTELTHNVVQLLYPNVCLICDTLKGDATHLRHGLCFECHRAVTTDTSETCPRCSFTVGPHTDTANGCIECRTTSFGFARTFRLGPYEGKLREAVLRTKSLGGEGLADMLGRAFGEIHGEKLVALGIDVVAPIPLHWWRRWTRGYNQSEAAAREVAAALDRPFEPHLLRRVRATTKQTQSSRTARQENVKGAFRMRSGARLSGRTVLLLDDVMTTGSTASEAAKTLLAGGAARVVMAVLARR